MIWNSHQKKYAFQQQQNFHLSLIVDLSDIKIAWPVFDIVWTLLHLHSNCSRSILTPRHSYFKLQSSSLQYYASNSAELHCPSFPHKDKSVFYRTKGSRDGQVKCSYKSSIVGMLSQPDMKSSYTPLPVLCTKGKKVGKKENFNQNYQRITPFPLPTSSSVSAADRMLLLPSYCPTEVLGAPVLLRAR